MTTSTEAPLSNRSSIQLGLVVTLIAGTAWAISLLFGIRTDMTAGDNATLLEITRTNLSHAKTNAKLDNVAEKVAEIRGAQGLYLTRAEIDSVVSERIRAEVDYPWHEVSDSVMDKIRALEAKVTVLEKSDK